MPLTETNPYVTQFDTELKELHHHVLALAAEHPGFIYEGVAGRYPKCSYNPEPVNPQGCIMGAAMRLMGWDTSGMDSEPRVAVWPKVGGTIETILYARGHFLLGDADALMSEVARGRIEWFHKAQAAQDQGATWSECVTLADTKVSGVWEEKAHA